MCAYVDYAQKNREREVITISGCKVRAPWCEYMNKIDLGHVCRNRKFGHEDRQIKLYCITILRRHNRMTINKMSDRTFTRENGKENVTLDWKAKTANQQRI